MKRIASDRIHTIVLLTLLIVFLSACAKSQYVHAGGFAAADVSPDVVTVSEYATTEDMNSAKAKMGVRTGSIQDAYTEQYLPDTNSTSKVSLT